MELLSINGLCHIVGIPLDTGVRWIMEFKQYVPTSKQSDATYYQLEAIDILNFIKACKEQNYSNDQITEMLDNKCFPVTTDTSINKIKSHLDQGNYKGSMLTVMQTLGITVSNVASQEKLLERLEQQQKEQAEKMNQLVQELETMKEDIVAGRDYYLKKEAFAKLFQNNSEKTHLFPIS
ncbi:MerR family transcriptional regulator [Virgibacillus sediminis]|uniref:MerR family transcriptional regulator n=1 Tax=Virgibacillus sediminis TaxID=202260 RepID=A0ABV7A8W6_9BACI